MSDDKDAPAAPQTAPPSARPAGPERLLPYVLPVIDLLVAGFLVYMGVTGLIAALKERR